MARKFPLFLVILFCVTSLNGCSFKNTERHEPTKKAASKLSEWPNGPVNLISPCDKGGLTDLIISIMMEHSKSTLSQPLLTENVPGEEGNIAFTNYLEEPANSNNLILGGESQFSIAPLVSDLPYSLDDFVPIINLYSSTSILAAHPSANVSTISDLLKYSDDKVIKIGTDGKASSDALQVLAFFHQLGKKVEIVPYDCSTRVLKALLYNEVSFAMTPATLAEEHVQSKSLIPIIAFDDKKYIDEIYNLDCVADYGFYHPITNIYAIFMKAGTDQKVIDKAYLSFKYILENKAFLIKAEKLGLRIDIMTGEKVKEYLLECMEKAREYAPLLLQ